jgi:four helix bundle protein
MSYKNIEVYKLAESLAAEIHEMTLTSLPAFEMFETGGQIRRSIKSVKSNIVEEFCRRVNKKDFIHFLVMAKGSAQETLDHLETLKLTGSLKDEDKYLHLHPSTGFSK